MTLLYTSLPVPPPFSLLLIPLFGYALDCSFALSLSIFALLLPLSPPTGCVLTQVALMSYLLLIQVTAKLPS